MGLLDEPRRVCKYTQWGVRGVTAGGWVSQDERRLSAITTGCRVDASCREQPHRILVCARRQRTCRVSVYAKAKGSSRYAQARSSGVGKHGESAGTDNRTRGAGRGRSAGGSVGVKGRRARRALGAGAVIAEAGSKCVRVWVA